MPHEPKLTVYIVKIKPSKDAVENSNRQLFKTITHQSSVRISDSVLFMDIFKQFIAALDTPEMFADAKSQKCMTANQPDLSDPDVDPNITPHSRQFIIEGRVEGGTYGRKRNKTSTLNKTNKSDVSENDAITEDFYFLFYLPPESNKIILMLQSYSDDTIDGVMKKFCENFFIAKPEFSKPSIDRFVPKSIIEDFKRTSTVSSLAFTTEVPSDTLMGKKAVNERQFRVKVQIEPINGTLSIKEFEGSVEEIQKASLVSRKLSSFLVKKGSLKDSTTNKQTSFELGSNFEIQPYILLSKYITLKNDNSDFKRIQNYCMTLLDEVKEQVYVRYATKER